MTYERTQQIEERFRKTIDLLSEEPRGAKQLSSKLDVSMSTVRRIIAALKRRGYIIKSVRDDVGWRYELMTNNKSLSEVLPK